MSVEQTQILYAATAFISVLLIYGFFSLVSQKLIEPFAKFIHSSFEERARQGQSVSAKHLVYGTRHRGYAWGIVAIFLFGAFGAAVKKDTQVDGETLARGFFATQAINCLGMNDFELIANETLCRNALKQTRGY